MIDKQITEIVEEIIEDIEGRYGFDTVWRIIEDDVKKNIKLEWFNIIKTKLNT